jgi:hypothetical protein
VLRVLAIVPWLVLGLGEVYLALGYAGIPNITMLAGEVLLLLAVGAMFARRADESPGDATVLPPLIPAGSALASLMPGGWQAIPYLVGLIVLLVAPVRPLLRGRGIPWWLSCALVVPSLLFAHGVNLWGFATGLPTDLGARLQADLARPLESAHFPAPADVGPPVIVISIDTLRADSARTMRSWKRLAERGAWWDSVTSTSSWTLPAMASMQTGLMPAEHGAGALYGGHHQGIYEDTRTLAIDLAERGYANAAVMSNPWVSVSSGLARGFHDFVDLGSNPPRRLALLGYALVGEHYQTADAVLALARRRLDKLADHPSFYLWVHLLDPHLPYLNSPDPMLQAATEVMARSLNLSSPEQRRHWTDAYQHEVEVLDRKIEAFLDLLEQRGLLERAVIVFTSDHGEELFDHGSYEHGHTHHGEVVEVPLVIVAPGLEPGRREGPASLMDVASTVRAAVGLPPGGVDLRAPVAADRMVRAQGSLYLWPLCSARTAERKVIVEDCGESDRIFAYDLGIDPAEQAPEPVDPTGDDDELVRAALSVGTPRQHRAVDANTEALRALGYVD